MQVAPGSSTVDSSPSAVGTIASAAGGLGGVTSSPLSAMRGEIGMVAALLAAAGLAWWSTADRMAGMDSGPGTALGSAGWFTGVWVTMMAAMMLPPLAPAPGAVFRGRRLFALPREITAKPGTARRARCGRNGTANPQLPSSLGREKDVARKTAL
jgi:hypothetical protein